MTSLPTQEAFFIARAQYKDRSKLPENKTFNYANEQINISFSLHRTTRLRIFTIQTKRNKNHKKRETMKTYNDSAENRIREAKNQSISALREAAKKGTISDENNPLFTFSGISTDLLLDFVRGEYDLDFFLRAELANRGLNILGQWIGFKAAEKEFKL